MPDLLPGSVCWALLDPTTGREQAGRRPVVVVSSPDYLAIVTRLAVVVPVSRTDRGWPNHVALSGAAVTGFAMTEQPRAISRDRLEQSLGRVDQVCLTEMRRWLADFFDLPAR